MILNENVFEDLLLFDFLIWVNQGVGVLIGIVFVNAEKKYVLDEQI